MPVYKDPNAKKNPWYYVFEVGDGRDRKRKKKRGFKTKKDAENAEAAVKTEINKGIYIDPSNVIFRDHLQSWLRDKKPNLKRRTHENYSGLINNHICRVLGDIPISKITPRDIQDFYNEMHDTKALCGENVQKCHTIIKNSLGKAAGWDMIVKNPATVVDRPEADDVEMKYWTDEDSHIFLETAKTDRYYYAFLLAITTGMRQGEILGLEWKDVDLKNRTISIRQILNHDGKEIEPGAKTISGVRMIGIDKVTTEELSTLQKRYREERMAERNQYQDNGLVICTTLGTPLFPRNLNRSFERLVKKANAQLATVPEDDGSVKRIEKIRFHDLRHTHVVMLLKARENNKRIAERMGWKSVKMIDRYAHIMPSMQQETADLFGDTFFKTGAAIGAAIEIKGVK